MFFRLQNLRLGLRDLRQLASRGVAKANSSASFPGVTSSTFGFREEFTAAQARLSTGSTSFGACRSPRMPESISPRLNVTPAVSPAGTVASEASSGLPLNSKSTDAFTGSSPKFCTLPNACNFSSRSSFRRTVKDTMPRFDESAWPIGKNTGVKLPARNLAPAGKFRRSE